MHSESIRTDLVAAVTHLDIHTLSEDWVLASALANHWHLLAVSLGLPPSRWLDADGERMYAGVMALDLVFDLQAPVREDDLLEVETRLTAIRKPHAISETTFASGGRVRARIAFLTSFIRRSQRGSNKKFSKVRGIWQAEDFNVEAVEAWTEAHHAAKSFEPGPVALTHEVNRIVDFNLADFMYFKNFVRIAKAAEYRANRGNPVRLNASRRCWFYGNVEDGQQVHACVTLHDDSVGTALLADDRRLLLVSRSDFPVCTPTAMGLSGSG